MDGAAQRSSASAAPGRYADWDDPTSERSDDLLIERLDDLADWSGWLTLFSTERELLLADVG